MKKVAIVGYGRMAKEYIKVVEYLGYEVCCILKRGKVLEGNIPIVYSIGDMLAYKPDYLIVVISQENIADFLLYSLPGKISIPILVEKPVAFEAYNFYRIKEHLRNTIVSVGYNRRFYKGINELKRWILKDGKIVSSVYVNLPEPIAKYRKAGVKLLYEYPLHYSASHIIDLLFYLFPAGITIIQNCGSVTLANTVDEKIPIVMRINFDVAENTSMLFNITNRCTVYEFSPIETLNIYIDLQKVDGKYNRILGKAIIEDNKLFKPGLLDEVKAFLYSDYSALASLNDAERVSILCNEIMKGRQNESNEHYCFIG